MKIELDIDATPEQIEEYTVILKALLSCGGLSGVKRGKTILHFDSEGVFQGIQLDYFPWKRRRT